LCLADSHNAIILGFAERVYVCMIGFTSKFGSGDLDFEAQKAVQYHVLGFAATFKPSTLGNLENTILFHFQRRLLELFYISILVTFPIYTTIDGWSQS
jgi:hypothetical protein